MKTTLQKSTLHTILSKALRFTAGLRSGTDIFGIFLSVVGDGIEVYGVHETRLYREKILCAISGKGGQIFTTDAKKLIEFLQVLEGHEISLEIESSSLRVTADKTSALFPIVTRETPPQITPSSQTITTIDPKILLHALPQLLFAVASDSARPTLSSIKMIPREDKGLSVVATDGFRLSLVHIPLPQPPPQDLQIPASFLRDVFYSTLDEGAPAQMLLFEDGRVGFQQGSIIAVSQLVAGDFPPYDRVMMHNFQHNIIVSRQELIHAVKTMAIFAREHSNIVVLEPRESAILVRPKKDVGEEARTEVVAEHQGQDPTELVVALNSRYLLDYLGSVEDDFVTIRINRPDAPILTLVGRVDANDSHEGIPYQHIIMPVRIQE